MSSKRMFSEEITSSDAFVDMPSDSQLLYFHLGMRADDDGFVSGTKMVQKIIGAGDDALMLLFAKKFLIKFDRGICVIKHWRMNNLIRKDIYKPTKYLAEKSMLFIKENGAYTLNEEGSVPVPGGHFTVDELFRNNTTSTLRRRNVDLGKVRLGKVREVNTCAYEDLFETFWKEYPEKKGKGKAFQSWNKLSISEKEESIKAIKKQVESYHFRNKRGEDFIPHPTTWLNQRRWEDEIKYQEKTLELITLK